MSNASKEMILRLLRLMKREDIISALSKIGRGSSQPRLDRYLIVLYVATEASLWNISFRMNEGLKWYTLSQLTHAARQLNLPYDWTETALKYYKILETTGHVKVKKDVIDNTTTVAITDLGKEQVGRMVQEIESGYLPVVTVLANFANELSRKSSIEEDVKGLADQQAEKALKNRIVGFVDKKKFDFFYAFADHPGSHSRIEVKHQEPHVYDIYMKRGEKCSAKQFDIEVVLWTDGAQIYTEFHFPDGYVKKGTDVDLIRASHTTRGGLEFESDGCIMNFYEVLDGKEARLIKKTIW